MIVASTVVIRVCGVGPGLNASRSPLSPGQESVINTSLGLFAVIALVLANGFFVMTEFSLISVRRTRIQQLASEGHRGAIRVLDRINHLDTYIAATQLGITLSSLGLGWIGEPALATLIEPALGYVPFVPEAMLEPLTHTISFIVAFSIVTALHIVIGELAPKGIALQRAESAALFVAGPIRWFYLIFRPAIAALNGVGNWVVRLIGIQPASGHALVQSAEELRMSVDASRQAGIFDQQASDLVDRAFRFAELEVRHAMIPRTEVDAVNVVTSLEEVVERSVETGHTRFPVYEDSVDQIIGVINVKRIIPIVLANARNGVSGGADDLRSLMGEPFLIPEGAQTADVMNRMREDRHPFAVVIDEYGGTAGIVTLEDLVEGLVGEIDDEHDPATRQVEAHDGTFVFDGLTALVEIRDRYAIDVLDSAEGVETVGGYVFSRLGRPARVGDETADPAGVFRFRVEEIDRLRVARVHVARAGSNAVSSPAPGPESYGEPPVTSRPRIRLAGQAAVRDAR